ncbi:unnamed protein product [Orchesella dallaii]|uniref:Helicase ATP-binding domain-containing protein n=1 Tax=Orchesella dallaii TaxID=48710 RepID=A0ABP1PW93_9HEXA
MDQASLSSPFDYGETSFFGINELLLGDSPQASPGGTESSSGEDPSGSNQSEEDDDQVLEAEPPDRSRHINDIPINFPGHRSERHNEILESTIYSLQESKNLLLECPVKSERRLATLCGVLAYRDSKQGNPIEMPSTSSSTSSRSDYQVPTKKAKRTQVIYYGVNQFEEVQHVLGELEKLCASGHLTGLTMAVLGDRKSFGCTENPHCACYNIYDNYIPASDFRFIERSPFGLDIVRDVEDFKRDCHRRQISLCPYLESKHLLENADLVICPQNFILSPVLRRDYQINLLNSILIFDDGFNMEKVCDSEASISLPTQELDQLVQKLVGLENSLSLPLPRQQEVQQIVQQLESSLASLSAWIKGRAELPPTKEDILEALQTPGFKWEQDEYDDLDEKLETLLTSCPNPDSEALYKIRKFLSILKTINVDNQRNLQHYHLKVAKCEAMNPNNNQDTDLALVMTCINPGIIFQAASAHTQTVIIAANCLAPINIFKKDLGVNFEEVLEIKSHEASKDRYLLSYCAVGPNPQQVRLNLDYESRSDPNVQDAVGKSLLEICEVIPNGVIAVFHTEHLLYPLRERWRKKPNHLIPSIMEKFGVAKHEVLCEMDVGDEQSAMEMFEKYRDSSKNKKGKGALLLVVARGKLWERIKTLKGEEVRAIIHVSVPYAAWDVEDLVVAKRRIICDSNVPEAKHRNLEWYNTEAYRIMNQSFSLCVQDRDDWGAVIVLDSRIIGKKNQFDELLPGWVRKEFKQRNFPEMIRGLERLVSSCRETDADDSG